VERGAPVLCYNNKELLGVNLLQQQDSPVIVPSEWPRTACVSKDTPTTYIHTYIHTNTYILTYIIVHTNTRAHMRTYIIHKNIHTHIYIHTYIRTYIHTYIRTYVHAYIHTYIHTYVPTSVQNRGHLCVYFPLNFEIEYSIYSTVF
jgi:hypothetical protein